MAKREAQAESQEANDWFLGALIQVVETNPTAVGLAVTVNVGGLLVTGTLTSTADYLENWNAQVFPGLEDSAHSLGSIAKELRASAPTSTKSPEYIHLRDARFILPATDQVPKNTTVWWRGALSHIDGWILGTMSTTRG